MLLFDRYIEDMANGQEILDIGKTILDTLEENDPTENDTVGSLCNKLSCVTIQMWHNQESLYAIRKMSPSQFSEQYKNKMDELHRILKRCCDLNYQRSLLMDAIDSKAVSLKD